MELICMSASVYHFPDSLSPIRLGLLLDFQTTFSMLSLFTLIHSNLFSSVLRFSSPINLSYQHGITAFKRLVISIHTNYSLINRIKFILFLKNEIVSKMCQMPHSWMSQFFSRYWKSSITIICPLQKLVSCLRKPLFRIFF